MRNLFIALILLTACGQEDSFLTDAAKTTAQQDDQTIEVRAETKLVTTFEDLETCGDPIKNELRYVLSRKSFYYCDLDLGWVVIDLKGAKGDDGKDGINGKDGKDGINGKDGKEVIVQDSEWVHPITHELYGLFSVQNTHSLHTYESKICPALTEEVDVGFVDADYKINGSYSKLQQRFIIGHKKNADGELRVYYYTNNGVLKTAIDVDKNGTFDGNDSEPLPKLVICKILEE